MPTTKAQQRATIKYMKNNYDEIRIRVPKERKVEIDARARGEGRSINGMLNSYLREYLGLSEEDWKRRDASEPR